MTTDTPSSRDEEIPTRRTNAVAKMIGSLAYQLKAGDINLGDFADVAQVELDKLGQLERDLIRLSAEREKERPVPNRDVPTLFPTLQHEIESLRATLAERDKELAEVKVKHEVACCTITTMQEERANRESYIALQNLSSFLSAGSGDDSVSAKDYETRIRWGINEMLKVETQRREAAEAQLLAAQTVIASIKELVGDKVALLSTHKLKEILESIPDETLMDDVVKVLRWSISNQDKGRFRGAVEHLLSRLRQSTRETEEKV